MKTFAAIIFLTLSHNSFADQCAYVTAKSASKAISLIKESTQSTGGILLLCQACGEKKPTSVRVNQIDVRNTGYSSAPKEIYINGEGVDLAYTYISKEKGKWINLAKASGCAVSGASETITEQVSPKGKVKYIPSPIAKK